MIQKVEMYQAVCDGCGKTFCNPLVHCDAFGAPGFAKRSARNYGWRNIDGKLYCPDCVEYEEETDSYKPKEKKL